MYLLDWFFLDKLKMNRYTIPPAFCIHAVERLLSPNKHLGQKHVTNCRTQVIFWSTETRDSCLFLCQQHFTLSAAISCTPRLTRQRQTASVLVLKVPVEITILDVCHGEGMWWQLMSFWLLQEGQVSVKMSSNIMLPSEQLLNDLFLLAHQLYEFIWENTTNKTAYK